jgi:hypothetical protein
LKVVVIVAAALLPGVVCVRTLPRLSTVREVVTVAPPVVPGWGELTDWIRPLGS